MSEALDVRIESRLSTNELPDSPKLGVGEVGLRIAAKEVTYLEETGELRLALFVSFGFPLSTWGAYKQLPWAIHVTVEDAAFGRAGAVPLKDPFVRYADDKGDNFGGLLAPPSSSVRQGWARVPLLVFAPRSAHEPSIYIKATLREHTSNVLSVNLDDLTVVGA